MLMSIDEDATISVRFHPLVFTGLDRFTRASPLTAFNQLYMKAALRLAQPSQHSLMLPSVYPSSGTFPFLRMLELFLKPWLHRNHDGKLNMPFHEISDHITSGKTAVPSKCSVLNTFRKICRHVFEKSHSIVRNMVLAASKRKSGIFPGLTNKAQQRITATFSLSGCLLCSADACWDTFPLLHLEVIIDDNVQLLRII